MCKQWKFDKIFVFDFFSNFHLLLNCKLIKIFAIWPFYFFSNYVFPRLLYLIQIEIRIGYYNVQKKSKSRFFYLQFFLNRYDLRMMYCTLNPFDKITLVSNIWYANFNICTYSKNAFYLECHKRHVLLSVNHTTTVSMKKVFFTEMESKIRNEMRSETNHPCRRGLKHIIHTLEISITECSMNKTQTTAKKL